MPIAFALGFAGMAGILVGGFPMIQLSGKMVHSIDNFPLMSIPLFMLAGQLMLRGGIMERLIDFANAVVGRVRGGLGARHGRRGDGPFRPSRAPPSRTPTALGGSLGPALTKAYGRPFGAALVASASNLGPIIPPSAGMILYAYPRRGRLASAPCSSRASCPAYSSVSRRWALCTFIAYRRNFPISEAVQLRATCCVADQAGLLVFMMPVHRDRRHRRRRLHGDGRRGDRRRLRAGARLLRHASS